MTPDEIREVFDGFIEYPEGSEKMYVTTVSTLIFARHVAKIAAEREREACARICDERAKGWEMAAPARGDTEACMHHAAKNEARALGEAIRTGGVR